MVPMPPEHHPIDLDAPAPVVEFGPSPAPRRRLNLSRFGRGLAADRRLVPLSAALGAVALLASLISEWQVTTVAASIFGVDGEIGDRKLPTDVTDLGAIGTGYLVGLFPLVAAVVLTLFGPEAGRRYARLAGLSVAGTLGALLVALTGSLGGESRIVTQLYTLTFNGDQMQVAYGRGLWCAYAGVVLAVLALYLAGRETAGPAWTWRPPRVEEESGPDEPLELTVGPARPFTPRGDDRDKPSGS